MRGIVEVSIDKTIGSGALLQRGAASWNGLCWRFLCDPQSSGGPAHMVRSQLCWLCYVIVDFVLSFYSVWSLLARNNNLCTLFAHMRTCANNICCLCGAATPAAFAGSLAPSLSLSLSIQADVQCKHIFTYAYATHTDTTHHTQNGTIFCPIIATPCAGFRFHQTLHGYCTHVLRV